MCPYCLNIYYYFRNYTLGWGPSGCPNAASAFMVETDPGAKSILSIALTAKTTKDKVKFRGACSGSNHFNVDAIYQE